MYPYKFSSFCNYSKKTYHLYIIKTFNLTSYTPKHSKLSSVI